MHRDTAILYSTAVCNLSCSYCYINKNKALKEIDKLLADSFADENYYFDFIKEYFPHRGDLTKLEVWGAETFMHMERVHPTLHKLIQHYLYFNQFFASTNFSYPEWCDKVYDLMSVFAAYPDRRFNIHLQMSMDGPENINDTNRGKGTTKACLENLDKFLARVDQIPENVSVFLGFKPTLTLATAMSINSIDGIKNYYMHFERIIDKVRSMNHPRVKINHPIPNLGVPVPAHDREDGLAFAEFIRNCREVERLNATEKFFKYYQCITPFSRSVRFSGVDTYQYPRFNCGTGSTTIGFLPNHLISSCHNGFTDVLEDYEKAFLADPNSTIDHKVLNTNKNRFTHTKEDYAEYERLMEFQNCNGSTCRFANLVSMIRCLAIAGKIDPKYITEEGAFHGAELFQSCTCNCVRDNFVVTGSILLPPEGMIITMLNGAIDMIVSDNCCAGGECNECY